MITFLIIVLLAPLQFQELGLEQRVITALLITVFVALCIGLGVPLLKKVFPNAMNEDHWTVGKEILLIFSVVTIIIVALGTFLILFFKEDESLFSLLFNTASITIGISFFPIIISVLFEQYHHQKLQAKKASRLTETLTEENNKLKTTAINSIQGFQKLLIRSENQNIELKLDPNDLIFLKSEGNYIEVYYKDSNEIRNKLIRNRMKSITDVLPDSIFLRCHKSFIVNGNYIIKVEGNARNLVLKLKGVPVNIPVSRAKVNEVSSFLETL